VNWLLRTSFAFVLLIGGSLGAAGIEGEEPAGRIESLAAAIANALHYTGFDKLEGYPLTDHEAPKKVIIQDDETPFLQNRIKGKEAWLGEYRDVSLKLKSRPDEEDKYRRRFEILIDPATGRLMKIHSEIEGDHPDLGPEPSAESAERQIRRMGEVYYEFAPDSGLISFLDALDACPRSALAAKEISALRVLYSKGGGQPTPVWVITFRGTPPHVPKGPDANKVPLTHLTHVRQVIDAVTGRVLTATNIPIATGE
jgi:hypothetical protein